MVKKNNSKIGQSADLSKQASEGRAFKIIADPNAKAGIRMVRIKPRKFADPNDPRCINYRSGLLIGAAFDRHREDTGETIPAISSAIGIGVESLYAYQRGHQVPTDASRQKLETHLGLPGGSLAVTEQPRGETTYSLDGDFIVVTTRIPRKALGI